MSWSIDDYKFMARAMILARQGLFSSHPNPRVGCVLVKDNMIVGEGSHIQTGKEHAEINAINQAGEKASGSTCYVTLEPCVHSGRTPPCTDGLIRAGVSKVISSMIDPNPKVNGKGMDKLNESGIEALSGLMENEAKELNKGYIKRRHHGLPYVRCKLAASVDGRTALASGESKWISGEQARQDVQQLRAESSAVMTGIGTILADNPRLNVRDVELHGRNPLRVIIDRNFQTPDDAEIFRHPGNIIVFTALENHSGSKKSGFRDVDIISIKNDENFLLHCMQRLAEDYDVNDVLLESGAKLAGGMLKQGLIDEFVLYQASVLLGDRGAGLVEHDSIDTMLKKINLELRDVRNVGKDLRLRYIVLPNSDSK